MYARTMGRRVWRSGRYLCFCLCALTDLCAVVALYPALPRVDLKRIRIHIRIRMCRMLYACLHPYPYPYPHMPMPNTHTHTHAHIHGAAPIFAPLPHCTPACSEYTSSGDGRTCLVNHFVYAVCRLAGRYIGWQGGI